MRSWEGTSDRAVYEHYRGRWIAPQRWIPCDGSLRELLLSIALTMSLLITLDGLLHRVVIVTLAVAIVYTTVRRLLPTLPAALVHDVVALRLPDHLLGYVPARYRETDH